jgi:hypothetical protein
MHPLELPLAALSFRRVLNHGDGAECLAVRADEPANTRQRRTRRPAVRHDHELEVADGLAAQRPCEREFRLRQSRHAVHEQQVRRIAATGRLAPVQLDRRSVVVSDPAVDVASQQRHRHVAYHGFEERARLDQIRDVADSAHESGNAFRRNHVFAVVAHRVALAERAILEPQVARTTQEFGPESHDSRPILGVNRLRPVMHVLFGREAEHAPVLPVHVRGFAVCVGVVNGYGSAVEERIRQRERLRNGSRDGCGGCSSCSGCSGCRRLRGAQDFELAHPRMKLHERGALASQPSQHAAFRRRQRLGARAVKGDRSQHLAVGGAHCASRV